MKTHFDFFSKSIVPGIAAILLFLLLASSSVSAQSGPSIAKLNKALSETPDSSPALKRALKTIYEATKRYQNIDLALKDGYIRDPMNICEDGPVMGMPNHVGAMGIHYFRPDLLGITGAKPRVNGNGTHTDFKKPAVLIYEPQADGSMQLVAVESLVFAKAWHEKNGKKIPEFMGYEYYPMIDNPRTKSDEAHMFEPHYDLHIWLFRENPNGIFNPFNPNVTCEHHKAQAHKGMKMQKKGSESKMD